MNWMQRIGAFVLVVGVLWSQSGVFAQEALPPELPAEPPTGLYSEGEARPFTPLTVRVNLPQGPTITATLVVVDGRGLIVSYQPMTMVAGQASATVIPRGMGGAHRGTVWMGMPWGPGGVVIAVNDAVYTLRPPTEVTTGVERFDRFVPAAQSIMQGAVLDQTLGDEVTGQVAVHGYRSPDSPLIWLRDHVYQMRGARYFDRDMTSAINAFATYQAADGSFPDYLPRLPWAPVPYRTPVEADVEFLFIQGVYTAWQAGAGDEFALRHLTAMRRAATYSLQDPLRWDAQKGLIRRPFTIDMWDFEVAQGNAPRHDIDANTRWGVFHGDNTGMAQALHMLATMEERIGDPAMAEVWRSVATGLIDRLNTQSWNGSFYRHFVFEQPVRIAGVDLDQQLSLSNAYALNRGVLSDAQANAVLDSYIARRRADAFAEWYSIDPPFPPGSIGMGGRAGERPGEYVNGGIMPLVGGELARGAFRMQRPSYGFATLEYYWLGMLSQGRSFLWYAPWGAEGVGTMDTISTDGWGAAAMLDAFVEGAVGVVDQSDNLRRALVAPQWYYAGVRDAYASVGYAAGNGYVAYRWHHTACWASIELTGAEAYQVALPIPNDTTGCSGVVTSPNGEVRIVTGPEGRVAVIDVLQPEPTVVVSW